MVHSGGKLVPQADDNSDLPKKNETFVSSTNRRSIAARQVATALPSGRLSLTVLAASL
jgi:hypothetical protein